MKNISIISSVAILFFASSCTKDDVTDETAPSKSGNTPTAAYNGYTSVNGTNRNTIDFFDFDHAGNGEKKYFRAVQMDVLTDTLQIVEQPKSINDFATGFPEEVRDHIGYGLSGQWANASYTLNNNGGTAFIKDTIPRNPASNLYYLNQTAYMGALAGKWPQAAFFPITYANGTSVFRHMNTVWYFKDEACFSRSDMDAGGGSLKRIVDLMPGGEFNGYDWKNVQALVAGSTGSNNYAKYYFLDFTNWRYFTLTQELGPFLGQGQSQLVNKMSPYKSLDKLLKWPAGWGKK